MSWEEEPSLEAFFGGPVGRRFLVKKQKGAPQLSSSVQEVAEQDRTKRRYYIMPTSVFRLETL